MTDRRQQPRRHEEAQLHYAEQGLLAVALIASDLRTARTEGTRADMDDAFDRLADAVAAYRYVCYHPAHAEARRRATTPLKNADDRWYEQHDGWVR